MKDIAGGNAEKPDGLTTELEEQLASPTGETTRQATLQRLAELELRLRKQIAAGVARETYADCQASVDAIDAASEIMQAWPARVREMWTR